LDPFTGNLVMIIGFVVGSGLVILEAFMPGFGVAGIFGIILEITAIVFTQMTYGTTWALIATLGVLLLVGLAIFLSYRSAMKGRLSKSALILRDTEGTHPAAVPVPPESRLNQEGVAVTALRPAGFIEIGNERLSAATSGEFLAKGTPVLVIGAEGDHLIIRQKN
jgi:membrane-bound serine protease (ClpP class)